MLATSPIGGSNSLNVREIAVVVPGPPAYVGFAAYDASRVFGALVQLVEPCARFVLAPQPLDIRVPVSMGTLRLAARSGDEFARAWRRIELAPALRPAAA